MDEFILRILNLFLTDREVGGLPRRKQFVRLAFFLQRWFDLRIAGLATTAGRGPTTPNSLSDSD